MRQPLSAFLAGAIFATGLVLSGMTDPRRIQAFLDFTGGAWEPQLLLVMGGALVTHAGLKWTLGRRFKTPVLAPAYPVLRSRPIDTRLLGGAALFGVGWGISGLCPGPAVMNVATGAPALLAFAAAMGFGLWLVRRWEQRALLPSPAASQMVRADPGLN